MSGVRGFVCALCCVFCLLLTASSGLGNVSQGDGYGALLTTFRVTSISQQLTEQGYKVRLHLIGSTLPKVYLMDSFYSEPDRLPIGLDGDVEFYNNGSGAFVALLHPRGLHFLVLPLSNVSEAEQIVPNAQLFMQDGNAITFEPGKDADANITFRLDNSPEAHVYVDHSFSMKSRTKDHVVENMYSNSPVQLLEEGESENERFINLRVNTSSGEVEGLLQIQVSFHLSCGEEDACLLRSYAIQEDIPVYRNDHAGPFPENFIGFVHMSDDEISERVYCSVHYFMPCSVDCTVIGNQPSPVEFVRVDSGDVQLNPIARISVSNDGYRAMGQLVFGNVSAGQEAVYQCSSRSGPEVISRTMKLLVIQEASITQSYVNTLDDGTVEAFCVAEGTPAPTVRFYFRNDTAMDDVNNPGAFEIVVTPLKGSTSEAVLRISSLEVANRIRDVRCHAKNVVEGRMFEDDRRMHVAEGSSDDTYPEEIRYYLENYVENAEGDRR